jgi:F420-0:gamma-glutamyl ligase
MQVTPIVTPLVKAHQKSLIQILSESLPAELPSESIVVISSKIVALCQGRVVPLANTNKEELLQAEADYYLPKEQRLHGNVTITHNAFIGSAGVDESNADGFFVLLPSDVQQVAQDVATWLTETYGPAKKFGVIITDSHSTPLRRGAVGIALAYAGFRGLCDYRGTKDLFDREMYLEIANHADALAAAAVFAMGEGTEQTPLALITNLPDHCIFEPTAPSVEELAMLFVPLEDDIFFPLIRHEILAKGDKKR